MFFVVCVPVLVISSGLVCDSVSVPVYVNVCVHRLCVFVFCLCFWYVCLYFVCAFVFVSECVDVFAVMSMFSFMVVFSGRGCV